MGNSLCKGRKDTGTPNDAKTPIARVIDRCVDIFPPSLGKKKHIWNEKVLETSPPVPPVQEQPKQVSDGWQTVGLAVPDQPPVAPPRKKRPSMLKSKETETPLANGLKENLNESGKSEEKSDEKQEEPTPETAVEDGKEKKPPTVTRKVSKVGNKKSDKFFGESLSDLSNDPGLEGNESTNPVKEVADSTVNDDVEKKENPVDPEEEAFKETIVKSMFVEPPPMTDEFKKEIQNQTAQLLFSLKTQCAEDDTDGYEGMQPVEEAPIVPVKKKTRHICDLEDKVCGHLHNPLIFVDPNAPKKPQRDFERYKRNSETSSGDDGVDTVDTVVSKTTTDNPEVTFSIDLIEKERRHSAKLDRDSDIAHSQEKITSTVSDKTETQDSPSLKPKTIVNSKSETHLDRSVSVPGKSPEGDRKLRKISVPEKISDRCDDGKSRKDVGKMPFSAELRKQLTDILKLDAKGKDGSDQKEKTGSRETISSSHSDSNFLRLPNTDQKRVSFSEDRQTMMVKSNSVDGSETFSEKAETEKPEKNGVNLDREFETFENFMKDNNIKTEDFLDFLEDELGDLLSSQWLIEKEKVLEQFKKSLSGKDNRDANESEENEVEKPAQPKDIIVHEQIKRIESPEVPVSQDEDENVQYFTDTVIKNRFKLSNMENMKPSDKRRHSIDDLDLWFSARKTGRAEAPAKKRRRKRSRSEGPGTTFERSRSQSLGGQPFEEKEPLTTPPTVPLLIECDERESTPIPMGNDHSPLLKFLDAHKNKHELETN